MSIFSADAALAALKAPPRGEPTPTPLEQAAFDAGFAAVARLMTRDPIALAGLADAYAQAEALWARTRSTPFFLRNAARAACGKGCSWCCHQRVGAAAVEVLWLAEALRARDDCATLAARLAVWSPAGPCAFLVEGGCSIYELRPMKCRALWHVDARHCMSAYAGLPAAVPPAAPGVVIEPKQVYEGALKGMALPLNRSGLDCPGVEFLPALKAVIDRPDATARWLKGEAVFPNEVRLDWFPGPTKGGKRRR